MRLARLSGVLILAALGPRSSVQDPAQTHDLGIRLRADLPLLVELRLEVRGTLEASAGEKTKKLELKHQTRLAFVDEFLARDEPEPGDLDLRRTYLLWEQDTAEGRAKPTARDNAFVGTSVRVGRRKGELGLELIDRIAPEKELQDLIKHCESVGWMELPSAARVGESFAVEPAKLINLLLDESFTIQGAHATFTLRAVDEQGLATLDGPLQAMAEGDDGERGTFEGTCALVLDTRAQLPRSIEWKGKVLMRIEDDSMRGELKGTFESRLALQAGEPARDALERKIVHRLVPRLLEKAPVRLELPSHWYAVEDEEGELFRTSVHGAESPVTLQLMFFPVSGGDFDSVVDAAIGTIEKDERLFGMRNVPSPFGKGRSARYQNKDDDGVLHSFVVEFYPCGRDRLMRASLGGKPDAFDEEFREWQKTLRTFELVE